MNQEIRRIRMRLFKEEVWHQAPATAVLEALQSDAERGLSATEATGRKLDFQGDRVREGFVDANGVKHIPMKNTAG